MALKIQNNIKHIEHFKIAKTYESSHNFIISINNFKICLIRDLKQNFTIPLALALISYRNIQHYLFDMTALTQLIY